MPVPPPPPVVKPGRVGVFQAVDGYTPKKDNELETKEGDLLYVTEGAIENEKYYKAKTNNKSGLLPCDYDNESAIKIDYPLHEAAKRGNIEFINECIENNVSVNSLDKSGSTALYWAAHGGKSIIVEHLLAIPNINITSQNKLGDTALHAASWKGHLNCLKLLIEAGADVYTKNKEQKKPIDLAQNPDIGSLLKITMSERVENLNDFNEQSSDDDEEEPNQST